MQGDIFLAFSSLVTKPAGCAQTLAPKYEKLGQVFAGEKGVLIGKVDATEDGDLASRSVVIVAAYAGHSCVFRNLGSTCLGTPL